MAAKAPTSGDSGDGGDSLPVQKAKRGMPKSKARVDPAWDKACANYWPTEAVSPAKNACV